MALSKEIRDKYQETIGLEVHIQLLTTTKAYSSDPNEYGSLPNTNVSVVTLAHPGTLPRSNKQVINFAIKFGLACNSKITEFNHYDRKNYFYPDLPKGYQLTQDNTPICVGGNIPVITKSGLKKDVQLTRIHMEEDSGKSMHLDSEVDTMVDLNRAGVPLLELVTDPDIHSSEEAGALLTELRKLVRYLDICDGNLEEGSMRCDANISVSLKGSTELGDRVEVKNMNSITNVQRAIEHEIERQIELVEQGITIDSETRLFDAVNGSTRAMRSKENLNDYRYFPEPDLQPIIIDQDWIDRIEKEMPPLPNDLIKKFIDSYGLPEYDAYVLTDIKEVALYFDEVCKFTKHYKAASNWVMGPVKSYVNELAMTFDELEFKPKEIADIVNLVKEGKVSDSVARQRLFPAWIKTPEKPVLEVAQSLNILQDSDESSIKEVIEQVIANNPNEAERYKAGEKKLLGLFMGQVMKASKGKADPKVATKLIKEILD